MFFFFFSSRRRHTRFDCDWSSDVCSSDLGSVLMGPADFITRARGIRRMLGGTMRQAGVIAAAGLVALEHMVDRLAEDHARARRLHQGLRAIHPAWCAAELPQTNIVQVRVGTSAAEAHRSEEHTSELQSQSNLVC